MRKSKPLTRKMVEITLDGIAMVLVEESPNFNRDSIRETYNSVQEILNRELHRLSCVRLEKKLKMRVR